MAVVDYPKVKGLRSSVWQTVPDHDAIAVSRLRAAGAVIVGTTYMYDFTADRRPRNMWDRTKEPGNSSRGSVVAVSAGMVPVAIAGDGLGSNRLPAAFSGIVGLHTTPGLVPHVDYDKPSFLLSTTLGPMSRSVRDCAIVTKVIGGPDGRDLVCIPQDPPDYLARINDGIEGLRAAWTDDFGFAANYTVEETPRVIETARAAAKGLASLGAIVEPTNEVWENPRPAFFVIQTAFSTVQSVTAVPSDRGRRERELDAAMGLPVQPETPAPEPKPLTSDEYQAACELRARNWERCRRVLTEHDVLLSATTPMVTRSVEEWGLAGRGYSPTYSAHTSMCNAVGLPAISVPCGFVDGLPVGLQIIARLGREDVLLRVASAFQTAFPQTSRPPHA
jgi:Asp-tRNA(Asn)/Glu-tRNA(Gln) amidotransferase A subunit family amidase